MQRSAKIARSVGALEQLFNFLEQELSAEHVDEKTAFCVNLAAEELFTNLVRHNQGGADSILTGLDISPGQIELRFVDRDVEPFDPGSVPEVDINEPLEKRRPGGLGVHLVRSIVDRLSYSYDNRELTVSVIKKRN